MKLKTMRILHHASVALLIVFLYTFISPFNSTNSASSSATSKEFRANNEEALALLKWKSSLDKESQLLLSSWEITSQGNHCSSWFGISCNMAGRIDNITIESYGLKGKLSNLNFSSLHHLTTINLYNNSLSGEIPSTLCQLRNLKFLSLGASEIFGTIPQEIGLLKSLVHLELSNNKLSGLIPSTIWNLSSLNVLYLWGNELVGTIPQEVGLLRSLRNLSLNANYLSGSIPNSIGNLSDLRFLYLFRNKLAGIIPPKIHLLKSLVDLDISENELTGPIPSTIGNLSSLTRLSIWSNKLDGIIPEGVCLLRSLTEFDCSDNNLSGSIPSFIGNLSNLIFLALSQNQLGGILPISLNYVSKLEVFEIGENHISGQLPDNICKSGSLVYFVVENNNISGHLPKTIKTCSDLQRVRLERNLIMGDLSKDLGVYPQLKYIDLSYNKFYGELSKNWGLFENLTSLKISNNKISGRIPTEIGLAQKLQRLDLSSNRLTGQVPRTLGKLSVDINLSNNRLLGTIPVEIGDLSNLETLSLAANNLSGFVPKQLAKCLKLRILNLSKNGFSGDIPSEIGNFRVLGILDLAQNLFLGEIPQELGQLATLETLNLSHNQFSGSIPHTFNGMVSLVSINLSYNQLEGPVPNTKAFQQASFDAFRENKDLCGNITSLKACLAGVKNGSKKNMDNTNTIVIIASTLSFALLILVISGFLACRKKKQKTLSDTPRANNENIFSIWSYDGKLVYENIIEDTENFDEKYCVGVGRSGAVYKVEQLSGHVFAVKKIHSVEAEHGELSNQKSFASEKRVLTEIRHRNIVKLYGFCSHPRHSFLVYEFLEGGDLHKVLINENKATEFEWSKRIDVIKDVANGLSYMHHECSPPIVHRDISSKNILLDTEYVAHISDFGTARILNINSTNCTSFAGTFGYAAPELAHTTEVNEMQDVYSFGVLTLEVLMGRHPGDLVFDFSSSSETPNEFSSTPLKDVLDPRLPIPRTNHESELIVCSLKLAFACLQVMPHLRPTMKQVSTELSKQRPPLKNFLFTMTLGQLFDHDC